MSDDDGLAGALAVVDSALSDKAAWRLDVRGTVQGVGFRPFVYRVATELGLNGSVRNAGGHVLIEAAGKRASLTELARRLAADAPPLAHVREVVVAELSAIPSFAAFRIERSDQTAATSNDATSNEVPPDIAVCADCLADAEHSQQENSEGALQLVGGAVRDRRAGHRSAPQHLPSQAVRRRWHVAS